MIMKKLKKEMKTLKEKMSKPQLLRVPPSKNEKGQGTLVPPSTPTRKQAKTPLRMTRPPKFNESPEVISEFLTATQTILQIGINFLVHTLCVSNVQIFSRPQ